MYKKLLFVSIIILIVTACGNRKWYSIEQQPAKPYAELKDGVYASGEYLRSAVVSNLNGKFIDKKKNSSLKVNVGIHQVTIYCDEANGEYNSNAQDGVGRGPINTEKHTKVLTLQADTQRVYRAFCLPYSHWWIEDTESGKVVTGEKPADLITSKN